MWRNWKAPTLTGAASTCASSMSSRDCPLDFLLGRLGLGRLGRLALGFGAGAGAGGSSS